MDEQSHSFADGSGAVSELQERLSRSLSEVSALRESEQQYRLLFEQNPHPILVIDQETFRILAVNNAAISSYGYSREEFLARTLLDIHHSEDAFLLAADINTGDQQPAQTGVRRHLAKDGTRLLVELTVKAVTFDGRPARMLLVNDVGDRERAQDTLRLLIEVTAAASEAEDVYAITARCLEKVCRLTGWPLGQAWFVSEGENVLLCSSSHYSDLVLGEFRRASLTQRLPRGTGLPGQVWEKLAPVWIEDLSKSVGIEDAESALAAGLKAAIAFPIWDGRKLIAIFEFFSYGILAPDRSLLGVFEKLGLHLAIVFQRKWEQEAVRHQAYHDVLTGLPNRVLFKDRITQALAHAYRNRKELAVLFLDLDRFKIVNDTHGHPVGDELLQGVASRLNKAMREMDTIARLGGDEFMVLLPEIDHVEDAAKVAQKILNAFDSSFDIQGHRFHITTSIGISIFPHDGEDAQTLMKNADIALYRAKEKGRHNYQLYTPAMTANAVARLNLENSLRKAIQQQEFSLHYQPQLDIRSGRLIAVEALLRWERPEGGMFMPAEFIPVAEDTGLISQIWEWALQNGCRQLKDWQQSGLDVPTLTMNISSYQFQHTHLVPTVKRILEETGVDPHHLMLEITEGMAMKADYAISILRDFKRMGIKICIDDFGTGYSSFGQLKRFPIDYLKIDPIFVREVNTDPNDGAIVTSIITLAHGLGVEVVAEGVETIEQLQTLRILNCDALQGFLISRPLPVPELVKALRKGFHLPSF
jgi:diguanylate cyclase (GGDEF)-like protein/PAS domain S-box-containing protein